MANQKRAADLRDVVRDLTNEATALLESIHDDTPADQARQIEQDHDALVTRLETAKRDLEDAERAERSEKRREKARKEAPEPHEEPAASETVIREAVDAERRRSADIGDIGRRFSMSEAMIGEHVRGQTTVEEFRAAVLDALADAQEEQGGPKGGAHNRGIEVGQDETVTRRAAMAEYILARNNAPGAVMTERAAALYRGMTAVDLIREEMSWRGESSRGLLPDEIAQRGLMSTSDFPNILADSANKTLRAAYEAAPRTFTGWARAMQLVDFKPYNILRRGETPRLKLVNEAGEFRRGALTESKSTIQLKTYGVVVAMTRQLIINDDLGALVGIPADFAQSAASLESDLVYHKLLLNAVLEEDGVALFDNSTHDNLASSGTLLGLAPLAIMRSKMAKQKGLDGLTVLNLMGSVLLVPPELETNSEQLLTSFFPATALTTPVGWVRSLTPISEARLSVGVTNLDAGLATQAGSATAYYLVSRQIDSIIYATLNGQSAPYTETRIGFDVDGVEIKCRHDFGCAAVDWRGIGKDPGAGS